MNTTIFQIVPYYPPHLGGMELYVEKVSSLLLKKGKELKIITSSIGQNNPDSTVQTLSAFEIAHTPIMPTLLFAIFKIPRNSLVHLHIAQAFTPEIVSLICRLKKIPYIAHVHIDVGPSGIMGWLLPIYKKVFLSTVFYHASYIIALNRTQKNLIAKNYNINTKKIYIIPNAIESELISEKNISKISKTKLLFVGRFSKQKNLTALFKIIPHIKNRVELHIVGSGEEEAKIKKIAQLNDLVPIKFYGEVDQKKLKIIYNNSDVFILPSEREGFPLVLLEAMACGLPVVANSIPELREIAPNEVLYVNINDFKQAAKFIDNLINDIDLQVKLSKAGNLLAKKYTWQSHLEKLSLVYSKALNL